MPIRLRLVLPLLALCLWPTGAALAGQQPCVLSQRWNEDPPYSMRLANGEIRGINIELVAEALSRMGCTVKLVEMPFARALTELAAGRLDILPGALRRPERELFAHFAQERWHSRNRLFAHVQSRSLWPQSKLAEIPASGFRLGVQLGVSYGPEYAELSRDPAFVQTLQKSGSRRNLWQMLKLRRIDGLIADELTARYEIAELGLQNLVGMTEVVASTESSGFAFSKATVNEAFVERFNAATEAMVKDGSYQAIVQKYISAAPGPQH
ncbi:transporter substrate-binding domain-containing protein [Pelomonas sp. SE-A7]|uniref:substrate-binding periplasmic protein n=1 Tax=Pelomonas sp. SE-A7 TaxID=3054953 RepID=UPI00259D1DFF|nr:transporter substrate-binding domain-containing protein [Pelomonas sp. SE-A7]MDM4766043.1 transporter substrate-binding domain-containing protein [Pelomonas sp. SE-A7]